MARVPKAAGRKTPELYSLKAASNPIENGSFGDVGAFYRVTLKGKAPRPRLEIPYTRSAARRVDESTLRVFRWDEEAKSLRLVPASGVDPERNVAWAWITQPGLYGVIGLPLDPNLRRTIAAFSLFSPADFRDDPRLLPKVCGLILCAEGTDGTGPGAPRGVCKVCLGTDVPELHIPEVQLFRLFPFVLVTADGDDGTSPPPPIWPTWHGNYRGTSESVLYAPTATPSVLWSFNSGVGTGSGSITTPVVAADGTVYVAGGGTVFAINGLTGVQKWSVSIGPVGGNGPAGPAIGPDGTVYANGGLFGNNNVPNGTLVAIRPDGTVKWTFNRRGRALGNPIPSPSGTVYVASSNEGILAIDTNGVLVWSSPFVTGVDANPVFTRVAVNNDGTLIVTGTDMKKLRPDQSVVWSHPWQPTMFSQPTFLPPIITDDGRVVARASGFAAEVVDETTGNFLFFIGAPGEYSGTKTGVILANQSGDVSAHAQANGAKIWSRRLYSGSGIATAIGVGADGLLYGAVPTPGLKVHAMNPATGADVWVFSSTTGGGCQHMPVPGLGTGPGPRGTLLVADFAGVLWALQ